MAKRRTFPTTKPYPTFPLTPRSDGRFVKKIRGQQHTFGANGDWQAAFTEYTQKAAALHAGRPAAANAKDKATVRQVANRYLSARESEIATGGLSLGGWAKFRAALARFVKFVGPDTIAATLGPIDFAGFAHVLRKAVGSYAYNTGRALIFSWLRYAAKAEWIPTINFGVGFPKVSAGKMRGDRKPKLFTPEEISIILGIAGPQMRAMILLGLNGGFGSTDCAGLTKDRIDLAAGVIRYKRSKTNIARTVPLWPETISAITPLLSHRPDDAHVFRTHHGKLWARTERIKSKIVVKDAVAAQFRILLNRFCLTGQTVKGTFTDQRPGVSFYALRHTFATYANEVRDSDARLHLMGRKLPGIDGDAYIEGLFLPRLKIVTDHVRSRLLNVLG